MAAAFASAAASLGLSEDDSTEDAVVAEVEGSEESEA